MGGLQRYTHRQEVLVYARQIPAESIYRSISLLRRARRNLSIHFDPPKLGDRPPTGELIAPLVCSTTHVTHYYYRSNYYYTAASRGGGGSLPCPVFGFYVVHYNEVRTRERSDRGHCLPLGKKASSYRGAYRVPLFNYSVSQCVCNIRRFH